jgi:hypothetical protein
MLKIGKKKLIVGAVATAVIAAGAGTALAYWTSTGTGSGQASTGTDTGITVYQTSTVANLSPGSTAQGLAGDFGNTNASPVKVTQVNVAIDPTTSWQGTCSASDYTLVQPAAQTGLVPVGDHVGTWTGGSIAMVNAATNQDSCKGQVVKLAYTTTTAPGA